MLRLIDLQKLYWERAKTYLEHGCVEQALDAFRTFKQLREHNGE